MITDPVILTEPLVRSQTWVLDPTQQMGRDICETAPEVPTAADDVPNHLPGTNPFLHEVADWYGLPAAATRGGAETMYPEYRKTMGKPENAAASDLRAVLQLRHERRWLQPSVAEGSCADSPAQSSPRSSSRPRPFRLQQPGHPRTLWDRVGPLGPLETLRVQRNVYAIFGAGGNVTVQIGSEGVLVVDSGLAASAAALLAEIRKLSDAADPVPHQHARASGSRRRQRRDLVGAGGSAARLFADPGRAPTPIRCSRSTSSRTNAC